MPPRALVSTNMTEPTRPVSLTRRLLTVCRVILGPILAVLTYLALPDATFDESGVLTAGLSQEGRVTAAVGVLMATMWVLESIPLSITALLPVTLLPLLGAVPVADAAAPYARDLLFLFFGGFMLGLAMEKCGLHKRVALTTLRIIGTSPPRIIAGFMAATALLSGWVSNTATAILMLPIAISVVSLVGMQRSTHDPDSEEDARFGKNFATALLLGIAYAASIGGIATLIGTPPNLVFAAISEETLGVEITMARWVVVAAPMVLIFLPIAWLLLTRVIFPIRVKSIPGARELVDREMKQLGRMSRGEVLVLIVFLCTATAWIFRPQIAALGREIGFGPLASLRDSSIALLATFALFMIPADVRKREFLMDWNTVATRMPWGIFLLFGGGLSLAAAVSATGVDIFIGSRMAALDGLPVWLLVVILATSVNFLTEITSNTAITTALLPVLVAASPVLGIEPMVLLIPATIAASFAFMLPVATPPNAVVFGSGHVKISEMIRAGFILNLIGVVFASVAGIFFSGFIAP